eukprot:Trichotokara_eunicae@DN4278_c0_g1_i2.p1
MVLHDLDYKALYSAYAGDSAAFIGVSPGGRSKTASIDLCSPPHRPLEVAEHLRLCQSGKHQYISRIGRLNSTLDGTTTGLAISRGLGDAEFEECGKIHRPEIGFVKLDNKAEFVWLCTDGFTDVLSGAFGTEMISGLIKKQPAANCAKVLVQKTFDKASVCMPCFDDTTVLVVDLKRYNKLIPAES